MACARAVNNKRKKGIVEPIQMKLDLDKIGSNLLKLATTEGPTQAAIQISHPKDPRIKNNFPIFLEVERILKELNLYYVQDLGNLIVFQGIEKVEDNQLIKEIRKIPVTLGAHLDEITYLISNVKIHNNYLLIPICSAPKRIDLINPECKIVGFRYQKDGELSTIGSGSFKVEYTEKTEKMAYFYRNYKTIKNDPNYPMQLREMMEYLLNQTIENIRANAEFQYLLETDVDVMVGDMVIQDYNYTKEDSFDSESILHVKALDDRVGCIAVLYALKELSELGIPCKAILTSSEEGVPKDVSWGRLVRPTYQKYCTNDGINIICDGIDGARLTEFEGNKGHYMNEAVAVPYTSLGKGGGDPGIFSIIRDIVLPRAKNDSILGVPTTDYVSRSYDAAIMHDFPLIGFVDWVNGEILNRTSRCHLDESIKLQLIQNVIGVLVYTAAFFDYNIKDKPNPIFPS